jgi:hypothetical protein
MSTSVFTGLFVPRPVTKIHHQLSENYHWAGVCCKFSFTSLRENNLYLCRKFDQQQMLVVDPGGGKPLRSLPLCVRNPLMKHLEPVR